MTSGEFETPSSASGFPRATVVVVAVAAGLLFIVGMTLYALRGVLAEHMATAWLREHGVASRLQIRSISLTRLSASLGLGDTTNPDFTVDGLEVGYKLAGPWSGARFSLQVHSVRLVRPHLKAQFDGSKVTFGALQPLIMSLSRGSGPPGGQPDVYIEQGLLHLATPAGALALAGDGALKAGALKAFNAKLEPFHLTWADRQVIGQGGALAANQKDGRLSVTVQGERIEEVGRENLAASRFSILANLPSLPKSGSWTGAMQMSGAAQDVSGSIQRSRGEGGALEVGFQGTMQAAPTGQRLSGRLFLFSQLASMGMGDVKGAGLAARLRFDRAVLTHQNAAASFMGDGSLGLDVASLNVRGVAGSLHAGAIGLDGVSIAVDHGRTTLLGGMRGDLSGRAIVSAAVSKRLASLIGGDSSDHAYCAALQRALREVQFKAPDWRAQFAPGSRRLTLVAPLTATTNSGALLRIATPSSGIAIRAGQAQGGASLALEGGGLPTLQARISNATISESALQADVAATGAVDLSFARAAQFSIKGRLSGAELFEVGARYRFDLAGGAPFSAASLGLAPNQVQNFSAVLQPNKGPLFQSGRWGWRAQGRLQGLRGGMTSFQTSVRGADGVFEAQGRSTLDHLALSLEHSTLIDQAKPARFRLLSLSGQMGLTGGLWVGDLQLATPTGYRVGNIRVQHDVSSSVGRADIDASTLNFTPKGLQPGDLSPLASFAKDAEGPASFTGWLGWQRSGSLGSGGELIAKSLKFTSPIGPVLGIGADLHFTSLAPLISAPDQVMTIKVVQAVTPLSALSARFDFNDHAVSLDHVAGDFAKGRIRLEPMILPIAPGGTMTGALVLDHVNIGDVIAASTLADTVKMDAVLDGRIPFSFGPAGLTIQNGRLRAVAPGRVSISRKALTGGQATRAVPGIDAQASFGQDIAYQAMENLAFDQLDASMDSKPGDRLGVLFHIKGRHDPPQHQRAVISVTDLLRGQPLAKPIDLPSDTKIDLTLDTSLNFGELVKALVQAWRDSTASGVPDRSVPVQGAAPQMTTK